MKLFPSTTRFPLDDKYYPSADITRYLEDSFKKVKTTHPLKKFIPGVWPTTRDIATLTNKSSGQFIYAATVVQYVSAPRNQPAQCLDVVLGLRPPHSNRVPFAHLDTLYTKIVSNVEDISSTLRILGFLLLPTVDTTTSNNLLKIPRLIERFLGLDDGEVQRLLIDLSSLVSYQDQDTEIRVLHASFGDFLLDETRSKEYFIDPVEFRNRLSLMYCEFVQKWHTSHVLEEDDDLAILHYSYRHLVDNCTKAAPSGDVLEELLETPIVPPLFYLGTYQDLQYFLDFFSCLESSNFANFPTVYEHHLRVWDEYVLAEMQNFPSLLYIYVCSVLLHADFTGSIYSTLCCLLPDHWDPEFSHIKWLYTWDRSENLYGTIERPSPAYRGMLLDFFTDEGRSGRYMLGAKAYAAVADLFLEYLSVRGTMKTRIETYVEQKDTDNLDELDSWLASQSPSSPVPTPDVFEDDHEPTIIAALTFLPILLSKSGYSVTLVNQIETHRFRDECKGLPELDGAQRAMSRYQEQIYVDDRFQRARRSRKNQARSL